MHAIVRAWQVRGTLGGLALSDGVMRESVSSSPMPLFGSTDTPGATVLEVGASDGEVVGGVVVAGLVVVGLAVVGLIVLHLIWLWPPHV